MTPSQTWTCGRSAEVNSLKDFDVDISSSKWYLVHVQAVRVHIWIFGHLPNVRAVSWCVSWYCSCNACTFIIFMMTVSKCAYPYTSYVPPALGYWRLLRLNEYRQITLALICVHVITQPSRYVWYLICTGYILRRNAGLFFFVFQCWLFRAVLDVFFFFFFRFSLYFSKKNWENWKNWKFNRRWQNIWTAWGPSQRGTNAIFRNWVRYYFS